VLIFIRQSRRFFSVKCFLRVGYNFVITGFNTDIEYGGVTYHVQTEDKGKTKPIILSLVYNGGTILASKRSPYDDLLTSNFNERILAERLNKQHRLICAAIQAGRIEDLKRMTAREAEARHTEAAPPQVPPAPAPPESLPIPDPLKPEIGLSKPAGVPLDDFNGRENPIPKPVFDTEKNFDEAGLIDEPIIEAVAVIEDYDDVVIIPDEAVAIVNEPDFLDRPDHNKLCIEILGDVRLKGGERNTVGFMVSRGSSRKVVSGAEIMVKILGSSFRPVIFHALTDTNGVATVNMQMPTFSTGRAAFLVRAISEGEEIELRRSIAHG
jgi:hypothetical protein